MESFGHFLFELLKIGILGYIYATLLFWIYLYFLKNKIASRLDQWMQSKKRLWFSISCFLLCYLFTPYGYHGLGDSARIPISLDKSINNINWDGYAHLSGDRSNTNTIEFTRFKVENNTVFGNLDSFFYTYKNDYFIYDIGSGKLQEFETEREYNTFATLENLPKSDELQTFEENYSDYWHGWRFFLLP
ncbi:MULTISPECIES: hypothetical protein [unclassified Flavobacterium]|uniref:hypothetical protein n=1 Tax=unclassified Flavobacterium TaxID=196869 RepID=UPI003607164E